MSLAIIIVVCILLLLAYIFELSSPLTKIPSVILLLFLGWGVRQIINFFEFPVSDFSALLQILGTIGLILIVLEGSLDLEIRREKIPALWKSLIIAIVPMLFVAFILAIPFQYFGHCTYNIALLNAIPFCVISSAIAIPSVSNLKGFNKEFVIYESSLSDIFGILFFNFIVMNDTFSLMSLGVFSFQIVLMIIISLVAVFGLSYLLSHNKHHINYAPIIFLVILIYAISKELHLPGLVFIIVFGLFLGNIRKLWNYKLIKKLEPETLANEVLKFKEINVEATFVVRALFFLLFGFLMDANQLLNLNTLPWALIIVSFILFVRWGILKLLKLSLTPLLYIAPRGLITILLFLAIAPEQTIGIANKSLIIQTIIISALVMMVGLISDKREKDENLSPASK
jgi:cell volume regulation protein A